jgi:hypothetical protein
LRGGRRRGEERKKSEEGGGAFPAQKVGVKMSVREIYLY